MNEHHEHAHEGRGDKQQRDPVCGMMVEESPTALRLDYKSTTYYFCSPGCRRAFEKNPEKYLREGPSMHM